MGINLLVFDVEGQTLKLIGEESVDDGPRGGVTLKMENSDGFLPEWTLDRSDSFRLIGAIEMWLQGRNESEIFIEFGK